MSGAKGDSLEQFLIRTGAGFTIKPCDQSARLSNSGGHWPVPLDAANEPSCPNIPMGTIPNIKVSINVLRGPGAPYKDSQCLHQISSDSWKFDTDKNADVSLSCTAGTWSCTYKFDRPDNNIKYVGKMGVICPKNPFGQYIDLPAFFGLAKPKLYMTVEASPSYIYPSPGNNFGGWG